jgi:hypothetical protein
VVLAPEIEKRGPVDPVKSLYEIIRVAKEEAAIMAVQNNVLIGTMGIIKPTWWFGDGQFLTDRWDAILPEHHHDETRTLLMNEVKAIADQTGLKFIHSGKIRDMKDGTAMQFPRMYTPIAPDTPTIGSA